MLTLVLLLSNATGGGLTTHIHAVDGHLWSDLPAAPTAPVVSADESLPAAPEPAWQALPADNTPAPADWSLPAPNAINPNLMNQIFEWTAPQVDTVEPTYTGSASVLGEKNEDFLSAINTEGAYIELEGHNTCSKNHGSGVQFLVNSGEMYSLGWLTGNFKEGAYISDVLSKTSQELPITNVLFQLFF